MSKLLSQFNFYLNKESMSKLLSQFNFYLISKNPY